MNILNSKLYQHFQTEIELLKFAVKLFNWKSSCENQDLIVALSLIPEEYMTDYITDTVMYRGMTIGKDLNKDEFIINDNKFTSWTLDLEIARKHTNHWYNKDIVWNLNEELEAHEIIVMKKGKGIDLGKLLIDLDEWIYKNETNENIFKQLSNLNYNFSRKWFNGEEKEIISSLYKHEVEIIHSKSIEFE